MKGDQEHAGSERFAASPRRAAFPSHKDDDPSASGSAPFLTLEVVAAVVMCGGLMFALLVWGR